jgi:transposase
VLYVGIDVAKRSHEVVLPDDMGETRGKPFSIPNSHAGLSRLIGRVEQANPEQQRVVFGLEATSHYWLALYSHPRKSGHEVVTLNPLQTSAYRRLQIRPVKNDRRDAWCIAEVLRLEPIVQTALASDAVLGLRHLSRLRSELVDQMADQPVLARPGKRRVLGVLDQVFPEFETVFGDVFGTTAAALLQAHPTPEEIAELDLDQLTSLLHKHSRGRFGRAKAEQIQEAAWTSFGVTLALDALTAQLQILLAQIRFLGEQVAELEDRIAAYLEQVPQLLTSIPGIGAVLASAILGEIGDIRRFKNGSALVAYAGIDPIVIQTGEFRARSPRMSKRGSHYLRRALWQGALVAALHDPVLKLLYEEKKRAGKHPIVAVGAVANKLVHIIYAVLRDNKLHVPAVREIAP